mgnify:CR=1 FL=1
MFSYQKTQQKIFDVSGVKVGGQPGENPTVLIGSIFYHGHKVVVDEKSGEIHKKEAEKLIKLQEEFSDKTGIPCMLDVVGSTKEAMQRFMDFVANVTEVPFLIDSPSVEVKLSLIHI